MSTKGLAPSQIVVDSSLQAYENPMEVSLEEPGPQHQCSEEAHSKFSTERPGVDKSTTYQSIDLPSPRRSPLSFLAAIANCRNVPKPVHECILFIVIFIASWLAVLTVVGSEAALPGGIIFVIVFLEFGGRLAGRLTSMIRLPPMVGMLALGIIIRNVPHIDFGKHLPSDISSPIRQLSLAIILTRAGLGLDLKVLLKHKWLIAKLAILPTVIEAVSVGILVHFLIGFSWLWSLLVGFVVAAVSPAVIVPRILALKELGYGTDKGIPTIILASASLDNIVAIALFGVVLGFTFSEKSLAMTILQGPIEIALGSFSGVVCGTITGCMFPPSADMIGNGHDLTAMKTLMVLCGSIASVLGYNKIGYSGAGVLSCLISAFTTCHLWRKRKAHEDLDTIKWIFTFLWQAFEPLLFGVIGCQIVVETLDKDVLFLGIGCILAGAVVRFITAFIVTAKNGFSGKERLFYSIAWVPKATVQAAIGPMALDLAQKSGNQDNVNLGLQVLTLAVLTILLTAPIGELGVIIFGPRFLAKSSLAI